MILTRHFSDRIELWCGRSSWVVVGIWDSYLQHYTWNSHRLHALYMWGSSGSRLQQKSWSSTDRKNELYFLGNIYSDLLSIKPTSEITRTPRSIVDKKDWKGNMVPCFNKSHLHDATCRMVLSFWRMKTTASAIISLHQLQAKFKTWFFYTHLLNYLRQNQNRMRHAAPCKSAYRVPVIILSAWN